MSWNYRVLRKNYNGAEYFEIHEVYYDSNGKPDSCTERAISPMGDTVEELKNEIEKIKKSFDLPVLNYEDFD
jgi:hypothetical protein